MEISQIGYWQLLFLSAVYGTLLGFVYEVLRTLRTIAAISLTPYKIAFLPTFKWARVPRCDREATPCCTSERIGKVVYNIFLALIDTLFLIIAASFVIVLSYDLNGGRFRWMVFVGAAIGFVAYILTVGKVLCRAVTLMLLIVRSGVVGLFRTISAFASKIKNALSFKHKQIKLKITEKRR